MNFSAIDWVILISYLSITIYIGIWVKKYVQNLSGYIVAGRKIKVSLGIATFTATELGTVTFVYFGELGYVSGFSCFIIGILALIAYTTVGKTGFIIEKLREYGMMTIPEFYELRFNKNVRIIGGIILFVGGVLNMGIFLKFDGIFLSEVMGFGPQALGFIMTFMLIIVMSYTILGGMFSVVITDFMQYIVLSIAMFATTIIVLMEVDLSTISTALDSQYGEAGYNPIINPRFGWSFIIWILVTNIAAAALWQPGTSKALSSKSPAIAKKVFWVTGLTFAGRAMIPMFWGVAALAYFGADESSAAAMPMLLGELLPMGLLGLLVAGLLAASMSTYSSYVLAWSSVLTLDVISCLKPGGFSEKITIWIARFISGLIGLFLLVFGLWYQIPETAFQYIFITGTMYTAGALGTVTAGLYWKKANDVGAHSALLLGAVVPAGFLILEKFSESLPGWLAFVTDVNFVGFLSFILAALGMIVGSLLTQKSTPAKVINEAEISYE
ncbi:MAG: sodium:solute symporter family protein [Balneolaceae bacterium]